MIIYDENADSAAINVNKNKQAVCFTCRHEKKIMNLQFLQ